MSFLSEWHVAPTYMRRQYRVRACSIACMPHYLTLQILTPVLQADVHILTYIRTTHTHYTAEYPATYSHPTRATTTPDASFHAYGLRRNFWRMHTHILYVRTCALLYLHRYSDELMTASLHTYLN